jgi:hypothetical protein
VAGGDALVRELDERANRLARHRLRREGVGPGVGGGALLGRSASSSWACWPSSRREAPMCRSTPRTRRAPRAAPGGGRRRVVHERERALSGACRRGDAAVMLDDEDAASIAERAPRASRGRRPPGQPRVRALHLGLDGHAEGRRGGAPAAGQLPSWRLAAPRAAPRGELRACLDALGRSGQHGALPPLCLGGTLHLLAEELTTDPDGLAAYFERTPAGLSEDRPLAPRRAALGRAPSAGVAETVLVLGGEASSWELIERIEQLSPGRIINHYGPTETTVGV